MTQVLAYFDEDTYLNEEAPTTSYQTSITLDVGDTTIRGGGFERKHIIITTDLSGLGIKPGSRVDSSFFHAVIQAKATTGGGALGIGKCGEDSNASCTWDYRFGLPIESPWSTPGAPVALFPEMEVMQWPTEGVGFPWTSDEIGPIIADALDNEGGILRLIMLPTFGGDPYFFVKFRSEDFTGEPADRPYVEINYTEPQSPLELGRGPQRGRGRGRYRGAV